MAAFSHYPKAQSEYQIPLLAGNNAYLGDVFSSDKVSPETPVSAGLYRLEKGEPLVYTYNYDEMKIILEGDFTISDSTGQEVKATKGDVFFFPKGATITFTTTDYGLAFYWTIETFKFTEQAHPENERLLVSLTAPLATVGLGVSRQLRILMKTLMVPPSDLATEMKDTKWVDGFRGIVALLIVSSYMVLCFTPATLVTYYTDSDPTKSPSLFQFPFLHLTSAGHAWVAIFFVLLGFVNSLKPLQLARSDQKSAAFMRAAVSSVRRIFRLVLPASLATCICWLVCQLGMYERARHADPQAWWLSAYTPKMSANWPLALRDLGLSLLSTWLTPEGNVYDQPQWVLTYLLQGSHMVLTALLMTINLKPAWRILLLVSFSLLSININRLSGEPLVGPTVFAGMGLAELATSDVPLRLAPYSYLLSPPLALVGLVIMSFPLEEYAGRAVWSNELLVWGRAYLSSGAQEELRRAWGSLGVVLLMLAIMLWPHARRLLSAKPLTWLGRLSFPMYLLHGTFMQSLLAWMVLKQEPQKFQVDTKGTTEMRFPLVGHSRVITSIAFVMALVLVASHYWALVFEPLFGKITTYMERVMMGKAHHVTSTGEKDVESQPILPLTNAEI
ncbi:acyltransferase family-domain-containing protein [Xylariales sp. PMI_506]|nr:acyltransferase family-domain-containing protein [Xylariales sp. PMI_506]